MHLFCCGELASRSRHNPLSGLQLASTSFQFTSQGVLPRIWSWSQSPRLGLSAKLLTLATLAYQDFVLKKYSAFMISAATFLAVSVSPLPLLTMLVWLTHCRCNWRLDCLGWDVPKPLWTPTPESSKAHEWDVRTGSKAGPWDQEGHHFQNGGQHGDWEPQGHHQCSRAWNLLHRLRLWKSTKFPTSSNIIWE